MGNSCKKQSTMKWEILAILLCMGNGQRDAFTQKCLSAEGVVISMYFWGGQAHEWDEMKKELEQLMENTEEKEKCFFPIKLEFEMKIPFQNFKILPKI